MSANRTLLIDADDTLWENNIYFERVTAEFVAALGRQGHGAERVDQLLWETAQRNVKVTGYGSQAFCQSLHEVARQLGATDLETWIQQKETWILRHPIDLMPGVRETLPRLHAANRLILLTKGREGEQLAKLDRVRDEFRPTREMPLAKVDLSLGQFPVVAGPVPVPLPPANTAAAGNATSAPARANPAILAFPHFQTKSSPREL